MYEYKVYSYGHTSGNTLAINTEAGLNTLARQGWELVNTTATVRPQTPRSRKYQYCIYYILRRPA